MICRSVDGQNAFYLYNGHADVIALIDGSGNNLASYYYDAFGNITEQTGNFNNNITYAGYQYDSETGKYYLMARMYDPVTARFMQEDMYRGDASDPLSLNLYTYCSNEPLMYSDPSGHSAAGDIWNNFCNNWKTGADMIVNHPKETLGMVKAEIKNDSKIVVEAWNNPEKVINSIDQNYLEPAAISLYGKDSLMYKVNKYIRTREEGAGITAFNFGKGIVQTGYNTIGKGVVYSFQMTGNNLGNALGIVDDATYRQRDAEINGKIDTWSNQMIAMPGNMWSGIKSDFGTTFNKQNAYNYFFNPDASLHDVTQYTQSTVNDILTVSAVGKLTELGVNAARSGMTRLMTPETVFAAEQSTSSLIRQRVLSNIAESKIAREASNYRVVSESKALQNYYPPNDGALGAIERTYLMPGQQIDRFGKLGGKYFSPVDTPMEMRALPSNANLSQYRVFEVVKPFEVEKSTVAPAFNQIGLGTQFRSPVSVETLLKRGIIKKVK